MKETTQQTKKLEAGIKWLTKNWKKIPDSFKDNILDDKKSQVIILLDRQKPSVRPSWDFDEERITVDAEGRIIWGFDSGCSCPWAWHDSAPGCYTCSDNFKEFAIELKSFDEGATTEALARIEEIKKAVQ